MTIDQELWFQREISRELQQRLRYEQQINFELERRVGTSLRMLEIELLAFKLRQLQPQPLLPQYRVVPENIYVD